MEERISVRSRTLDEELAKRINQCDIFHDIEIVEHIEELKDGIKVTYIKFPLVMCLNQDCDLNSDNRDKEKENNRDCQLLNLTILPLFNFDSFLQGNHWGDIFSESKARKKDSTETSKIKINETPRYHFLRFEQGVKLPDLIIDFKHVYTVSTQLLYNNLDKRVCSISELYRERISQRFSEYFSRIGLPD